MIAWGLLAHEQLPKPKDARWEKIEFPNDYQCVEEDVQKKYKIVQLEKVFGFEYLLGIERIDRGVLSIPLQEQDAIHTIHPLAVHLYKRWQSCWHFYYQP
jgi:hypothetical protein